jgi:lysophospholipase L1-like esterase
MKQPNIENIFQEHDDRFFGALEEFKNQAQANQPDLGEFHQLPDFQSIEWEAEYAELLADVDQASQFVEAEVPELPEPKWKTASLIAETKPQDSNTQTVNPTTNKTITSRLLPTAHDDDGAIDVALGVLDDTKKMFRAARGVARSVGVTPLRTAAAGVAMASVLTVGTPSNNTEKQTGSVSSASTEAEQLIKAVKIDGVKISSTDKATVVTMPLLKQPNQDPGLSAKDASQASGLPEETIEVVEDQMILPKQASSQEIVSAVISAAAPDVFTSPTTPVIEAPKEQPKPTKPVEQMTDPEYIDWLADSVEVSASDYQSFDVDTSRVGAFADELTGKTIKPTAFVGHWTAAVYKNGVDQFIGAIKGREGRCCSVMYFMDREAKVYRFVNSNQQTAHAKGANEYTQGVEIEARGLRDYTPEQMTAFVKLGYRFMTANDIPIERKNFIGHMELGTGKPDMPPQLVDKLFVKLQELDRQVKQADPITPNNGQNPNQAMDELLAEIRSHEGNFDSINRSRAGDTETYSDEYFDALGGQKLSQLTIKHVMDLQAADKIMAVGGYQFIPGTFRSAVKATGIDVNRVFDEAAQTELAINYLILGGKRPALTAYLKGESDDVDKAMQDMCMEWASIPCANGLSYYHGDGAGNAAHGGKQQYAKIRQLLINIRSAGDKQPEPAKSSEVKVYLNNKVVVIGDSLTVGYTKFGDIQTVDQASGLDVIVSDGVGGRPLVGGDDDGIKAIERHLAEIKTAGAVVIGLGTNAPESDETYKAEMQKAVKNIHSADVNPNASILLIKGYSYRDGTKSAARRDRRAAALDEIASQNPNVHVLDLSNILTDDMFSGDDIHLTSGGYQALTTEILKRTAEVLNSKTVEADEATNASQPEPKVNIDKLPLVPKGELGWFDIDQTSHIYEPYFRNADGSIDQAGLNTWIGSIQKAKTEDGEIKYQVTSGNTPDRQGE